MASVDPGVVSTKATGYDARVAGSADPDRNGRRLLLVLGAAVAFALLPLLSGLFGAAMLLVVTRPLHQRVSRYIGRRTAALAISMMVVVLLLIPGTWLVTTIIAEGRDAFRSWQTAGATAWLDRTPLSRLDLTKAVETAGSSVVTWLSTSAVSLFGNVTLTLLNVVVALFGLYYLLVDGDSLWRRLRRLIPGTGRVGDVLVERFVSVTEALLLGSGLTAVLQGSVVGIAFAIVGLPAPVLWGFVTACVSVLPLFGSALVWAPGVVFLLSTNRGGAALLLGILGAGVASNLDNLARLVVYRRVSGIHPMLTLVGAIAGVHLVGPVGVFLGPLALSYVVELIRTYEEATTDRRLV